MIRQQVCAGAEEVRIRYLIGPIKGIWFEAYVARVRVLELPACDIDNLGYLSIHKNGGKYLSQAANRRTYACAFCGHRVSPTTGTVLDDARTPRLSAFDTIYFFARSVTVWAAQNLAANTV